MMNLMKMIPHVKQTRLIFTSLLVYICSTKTIKELNIYLPPLLTLNNAGYTRQLQNTQCLRKFTTRPPSRISDYHTSTRHSSYVACTVLYLCRQWVNPPPERLQGSYTVLSLIPLVLQTKLAKEK